MERVNLEETYKKVNKSFQIEGLSVADLNKAAISKKGREFHNLNQSEQEEILLSFQKEALVEAQEEIIGEIDEVVDSAEEMPMDKLDQPEIEIEFDPKVLASNFVEEVRTIFEAWSLKMDGLYPNEQRHDATMWEQGSPNDWMTPFSQELYESWLEYDAGNSRWFETLVPFLKEYTDQK